MPLASIFRKAYWALAGAGGLYVTLLLIFTTENLQRHALYLHKIHTAWFHNINEPENFGFAKNQITPFEIHTPDRETLYAWHILPIGLYERHQERLLQRSPGLVKDVVSTESFRLFSSDPESKLLINFHGNAGTVAQGWRTDTYRSVAAASSEKLHVLSFDYRGFGYSTGYPTEEGIIIDAIATVKWALDVAHIPPERIVLMGQSLGTAVTAAVSEHFARNEKIDFSGVILVASFTDIPSLMLDYSLGGIFQILGPLRSYPRLQNWFAGKMKDSWKTKERLPSLVRSSRRLRLFLIHSKNDPDIPFTHTEKLFYAAANATSEKDLSLKDIDLQQEVEDLGQGGTTAVWRDGKDHVIRKEILRHGGHNRIVTYAPITLAVRRAFGM